MILTILNNSRLGLKLFVLWLIFGVGLLPDKTEGSVKCYKCDGAACKSAPPDIDCASGFCLTINKGKDSEKKDCAASENEGKCIKEKGGCFTGTDDNQADMDGCLGTEAKTAVEKGSEICVCEGDHCNGETKDDNSGNKKGDAEKGRQNDGQTVDDTTPPDKVGKCYECFGAQCSEAKIVERKCYNTKFCKTVTAGGSIAAKTCFFEEAIAKKCFKGGCLTKTEEDKCSGESKPGSAQAKTCVCEGDLCNTGGDAEQMISNGFLVYLLAMMGISAI